MKKILVLIFSVVCIMTNVNAQEVRGVETKLVKYHGSEYDYYFSKFGDDRRGTSDLWFGYSFRNMNSIPVSVDIELYADVKQEIRYGTYEYVEKLLTTKTIVLEPGEEYIFKRESDDAMKVFLDGESRDAPRNDWSRNYRVTYKAYKLQ